MMDFLVRLPEWRSAWKAALRLQVCEGQGKSLALVCTHDQVQAFHERICYTCGLESRQLAQYHGGKDRLSRQHVHERQAARLKLMTEGRASAQGHLMVL